MKEGGMDPKWFTNVRRASQSDPAWNLMGFLGSNPDRESLAWPGPIDSLAPQEMVKSWGNMGGVAQVGCSLTL